MAQLPSESGGDRGAGETETDEGAREAMPEEKKRRDDEAARRQVRGEKRYDGRDHRLILSHHPLRNAYFSLR